MPKEVIRPVRMPHKVTSGYGSRTLKGQVQWHNGIDYITAADPGGDWTGDRSVLAMADGEVVYDMDNYDPALRWTSPTHSAGNYIIIKHKIAGNEYYVRYLHLGQNYVSVGQQVMCGDVIGYYADAGYSFGPHLHIDFWTMGWVNFDPTRIILDNLKEQ